MAWNQAPEGADSMEDVDERIFEITGELSSAISEDERARLLIELGLALSAELGVERLLDRILRGCRQLTMADAGSIYIINRHGGEATGLTFTCAQCDSMEVPFQSRVLPLRPSFIAGYVGLSGQCLNIPDVEKLDPSLPFRFDAGFDHATGYKTRSMLVLPMSDHKGKVLGVVQLINRKTDWSTRLQHLADFTDFVQPFDQESVGIARSMASQAAVAFEKARLIRDMEKLFEGFISASVRAIDARDPATSDHSLRVTEIAMALARAWNRSRGEDQARGALSEDEMRELRYAALLHDFGKIGVPERLLRKATRLSSGQVELVRTRFKLLSIIAKQQGKEHLISLLNQAWEVISRRNGLGWISEQDLEVLQSAAAIHLELDGEVIVALTSDEMTHLSVPRGNLTDEERRQMNSHPYHTKKFLETIPWTEELRRIPSIASGHHEKLDGSGYPLGLKAEQLLVQHQILTVADMAEALTAKNRPYRKAIPSDKVMEILWEEVAGGKLSEVLVRLFQDQVIGGFSDDSGHGTLQAGW